MFLQITFLNWIFAVPSCLAGPDFKVSPKYAKSCVLTAIVATRVIKKSLGSLRTSIALSLIALLLSFIWSSILPSNDVPLPEIIANLSDYMSSNTLSIASVLHFAILLTTSSASCCLPFASSHLGLSDIRKLQMRTGALAAVKAMWSQRQKGIR